MDSKILARAQLNRFLTDGFFFNNFNELLNIIKERKYVWIHIKCVTGTAYWIKSNELKCNKIKTKYYVNNLKAIYISGNDVKFINNKYITLIKPDTETREIIIYDNIPETVIKRYIKYIEDKNKEMRTLINKNNDVLKFLKHIH